MRRIRLTKLRAAIAGAVAAVVGGIGIFVAGSGGAANAVGLYPVIGSWTAGSLTAATYYLPPPGANNGCKPNAQHPTPIVLVHGTFEDQYDNWAGAAPWLANRGFCVFTFNYGGVGPFEATGDITQSARQLNDEINHVLQVTGASKVDILGHSQGGMMPREYLKLYGGSKVDTYVALAPSNYGTSEFGLVQLGRLIPGESLIINGIISPLCTACVEQESGSAFLNQLNAGSDTISGVKYVVIETIDDEVVTPYTNAFLHSTGPNVRNITLQTVCPQDASEHLQISYDSNAWQIAQKAFNGTPLNQITNGISCSIQLPLGV